jgi:molecular chaperone DnaK
MAGIFGLDFGTTNSVAAFIQRNPDHKGYHANVLTDRQGRPHPSVVWYNGAEIVVGRQAKENMGQLGLGVFGDVVRSPKMFLGSTTGIHVGGVSRPAAEVVADILRYVKDQALQRGEEDQTFDRAVLTVPVSMDGRARLELRQAALAAGIHVHQFVHEPLAALYGHLRAQENFAEMSARMEGRLALVYDWGGGTLDLTLCRLHHGTLVQILNLGDQEVGGDKFDLELVRLAKRKHAEHDPAADWSKLQPSAEARLISQCEAAKIRLSDSDKAFLLVKDMLASAGPEKDLDITLTRQELLQATSVLVRDGLATIDRLLDTVGVPRTAVEFCLVTGGMSAMPAIREGLIQYFDAARVRTASNAVTSIAEGAAWIAHDGVRITLAKPIEVLNADDVYLPVFRSGTMLPLEGDQISEPMSLYCVDPRDQKAKLTIARNRWPGREGPADPRLPYGCLTVSVDPMADPLMERLKLVVAIDHNCVARVTVHSSLVGDHSSLEINNLEFGLKMPNGTTPPDKSDKDKEKPEPWKKTLPLSGSVRVRSNVTKSAHAKHLIPGEIAAVRTTQRQHDELMYYKPCSICDRNAYQIERFGCDRCAEHGQALSPLAAEERWARQIAEYTASRKTG